MAEPDKLQGLPQPSSDISSSKPSPPGPHIEKKTSPPSPPGDSVTLSPENTEYAQVLTRIGEIPDIREERVEEIKKSFEAGTYNISPQLVADRIIREIVSEGTSQKNPPNPTNSPKAS